MMSLHNLQLLTKQVNFQSNVKIKIVLVNWMCAQKGRGLEWLSIQGCHAFVMGCFSIYPSLLILLGLITILITPILHFFIHGVCSSHRLPPTHPQHVNTVVNKIHMLPSWSSIIGPCNQGKDTSFITSLKHRNVPIFPSSKQPINRKALSVCRKRELGHKIISLHPSIV